MEIQFRDRQWENGIAIPEWKIARILRDENAWASPSKAGATALTLF